MIPTVGPKWKLEKYTDIYISNCRFSLVIISKTKFFLAWKNVWPLHDLHNCLKLILLYPYWSTFQIRSFQEFSMMVWRLQEVKTENSDMYIKIGVSMVLLWKTCLISSWPPWSPMTAWGQKIKTRKIYWNKYQTTGLQITEAIKKRIVWPHPNFLDWFIMTTEDQKR